jgi:hypothetical protein
MEAGILKRAWSKGRALNMDEAVALALSPGEDNVGK